MIDLIRPRGLRKYTDYPAYVHSHHRMDSPILNGPSPHNGDVKFLPRFTPVKLNFVQYKPAPIARTNIKKNQS